MNTEYKLSGKSGNIFIVGILLGPILVTLLSIIYAYIDLFNPFIYLTLLVFIGLLFGIIIVQKLVIRLSKCRSKGSSIIYGSVTGLFGVYASWFTFLYVMFRKDNVPIELLDLMLSPKLVFDWANALSIEGYFTLFGIAVKGGFLWFIWLVEAIGIIGAGAIGGLKVMHEEVFCEDCNRWAEDLNFDLRLNVKGYAKIENQIKEDVMTLLNYPKIERITEEHLKINIHRCSNCLNTATIDVDLITYETDEKGKVNEKNEDFSNVYILSANQFNLFLNKKNQTNS